MSKETTFTFSFSVLRAIKTAGADVQQVRNAVQSAIAQLRAKAQAEDPKVKLAASKADGKAGQQFKIKWSEAAVAKGITPSNPLRLALLSQAMDDLAGKGIEPVEIVLPEAIDEWILKLGEAKEKKAEDKEPAHPEDFANHVGEQ